MEVVRKRTRVLLDGRDRACTLGRCRGQRAQQSLIFINGAEMTQILKNIFSLPASGVFLFVARGMRMSP